MTESSVNASSQTNPVRRSPRVDQVQARAVREAVAGAINVLTGGGRRSFPIASVDDTNPGQRNIGSRVHQDNPALPKSGPRVDEFPFPSVGGPVVYPKRVVKIPCSALPTIEPREQRNLPRKKEGIGNTHRVRSTVKSPNRHV